MQDFRNIRAWQAAHVFRLHVYEVCRSFPSHERYGRTSQLLRSSRSIATNLAEGAGRHSDADFARFVQMAMSSATETLDHLIVARAHDYISQATFEELEGELLPIRQMLTRLLQRLRPG